MAYGGDYYLLDEVEDRLLAAILTEFDPENDRDRQTADRVLCNMIELGLADAERGPAMYRRWVAGDLIIWEEE